MRPRVTTRPVVGCRMPLTICSSVLLPQPLGPTSPSVSPFSTVETDVAQRPEIGVARPRARQQLVQPVGRAPVQTIELGDVLNQDQIRS